MGDSKVPFGHDGFNQRINKVGFYFSSAFENVFMCQGYSQYDLAKVFTFHIFKSLIKLDCCRGMD